MVSIIEKISSHEIINYVNSISQNKIDNEIKNFDILEVKPLNKFQSGALSFAKNLTAELINQIPTKRASIIV